jgi:hypothetical protein
VDVVQLVKDGKCKYEWYEVVSTHNNHQLHIKVLRDALKFDDVPPMTWDLKPIAGDHRRFNGVRLPATAHQLQEIADLLGGMLLTPKIIDLIWLQATLKFDAVININGHIVATSNIHDVHNAIEKKIGTNHGTDLISCVGKYWCVINELATYGQLHGDWVSCNYGWFAQHASGPGITPGTSCWQRPGFRHNKQHWDPSQTIRLMHRKAWLFYPDGSKDSVDLHDIAVDAQLAPLLHHQGILKCLRQPGVDELPALPEPDYVTIIKPRADLLNSLSS